MQRPYANISEVFAHLARARGRLSFAQAATSFDVWHAELRERLIDLLRLPVLPTEPPPVEVITSEDCGAYIREKIVMRAVDDLGVPAYLLRPARGGGSRPAVLAIHGHGPGKSIPVDLPPPDYDTAGITEGQRDYAIQAVNQGMIALAPDLRGFGELMLDDEASRQHGNSCTQLACRAMQAGRNLLGMRIADLIQFVDWLEARDDVDPKRICATGNSGGGTATLFLAAVESRIAVAVPGCYFCTFQDSTLAIHHCPCNYVPDLSTYAEMYDVAGLIAPRPLLVVAGQDDDIFPIQGVRRAFEELKEIYAAAHAERNIELYVGKGGHRYFSERVWPFIGEKLADIE
ncbi:MAG: prolyl oligopeptidase family serine peptidase [Phycisphaerae bacterium]|nr:prolyl oligopeptidase family serine peptidase [Phycisphaerae bacterium]